MHFVRTPGRAVVQSSVVALAVAAGGRNVYAQSQAVQPAASSSVSTLPEVVVTAQKREQSLNDVPMSIVAISNSTLQERGITDTGDLDKLVPGFTSAVSNTNTPVYTLRGIGLYDSGIASSPTVSVYVDQVPLPFPVMTTGAALDLERVEVLKGPQGILFGQNSTGGAINYTASQL
jgi:iron complex outermembrane receptor protein